MKHQIRIRGIISFLSFALIIIFTPVLMGGVVKENKRNLNPSVSFNHSLLETYTHLQLQKLGLSEAAFSLALSGYACLNEWHRISKQGIITIIDFTRPSTEKRLFVLDLIHEKIIFNTWVAHGKNSGKLVADKFSNQPESLQSSLGFFLTGNTYSGKHGVSLKLHGLEKNINDKAEDRAVVIHGASYVSENFIQSNGYLGRSWGCPALPEILTVPIINEIKEGSMVFIYANDKAYLNQSHFFD